MWDKVNFTKAQAARDAALAELSKQDPKFSRICEPFIFDQRDFSSNKACRKRLQQSGHEFFVGPPYLDMGTAEKVLGLATQNGTLRSDLRRLSNKRMGSEICAAHDLSPIFENPLSVK